MGNVHVPAWKKLGLKLKYAKDIPSNQSNQPIITSTTNDSRKTKFNDMDIQLTPPFTKNGTTPSPQPDDPPPPTKKQKRVSFSTDTKRLDGDTARSALPSEITEQLAVARKSKANHPKPPSATHQTPASKRKTSDALDYLHQYYYSHTTWKFNKNREIWILKHALNTHSIPAKYNLPLAQYIYGLKSTNSRQRLHTEAETGLKAAIAEHEESATTFPVENALSGQSPPHEFNHSLKTFPRSSCQQDDESLSVKLEEGSRSLIVLWALDPDYTMNEPPGETSPNMNEVSKKPAETKLKKKKNRTVVVDFSSSSSESSSSESDDGTKDDETSSSGSSSSSSSSSSPSSPSSASSSESESDAESDSTSI